jgi:hypothetical protein
MERASEIARNDRRQVNFNSPKSTASSAPTIAMVRMVIVASSLAISAFNSVFTLPSSAAVASCGKSKEIGRFGLRLGLGTRNPVLFEILAEAERIDRHRRLSLLFLFCTIQSDISKSFRTFSNRRRRFIKNVRI